MSWLLTDDDGNLLTDDDGNPLTVDDPPGSAHPDRRPSFRYEKQIVEPDDDEAIAVALLLSI